MALQLSFNPVWSMQDLNGLQLDDTYYMFTLSNIFPYAMSPIYLSQNIMGPKWSDPIQFLANGTLPTNLYWDNSLVYRIEIRQGNMQSDPLIYLIENYIPIAGGGGPTPPSPGNNSTDNLLTNPQFADVAFIAPFTITTATTTAIAPGWQIVTTGAGTLTVSQVNISGVQAVIPEDGTNQSYYISLANNNFSTVTLQQVFNRNGALWTNQAAAFAMSIDVSAPVTISSNLTYSTNVQTSPDFINTTINATGWQSLTGAVEIDSSVNTNTGTAAYTTLNITWSGNLTVNLTSIQLVGQDVMDSSVTYAQIPIERQIDHEFHYYFPQLAYKPIPSYLVAWDFPLNPAQDGDAQTVTTTPAYIWDQTIMASAVANFNVVRTTAGALSVTSTGATDGFYMLQYLSGPSANETILSNLSVNILAYCAGHAGVTAQVLLFGGNTSSTIPVVASPTFATIGGISINSVAPHNAIFTLTQSNWYQIAQAPANANNITLVLNQLMGFPMSGWNNTNAYASGINSFAIVVVFTVPTSGTSTIVNSISCVPGLIATRPAPQTYDEVLKECRYYYERSWAPGVALGTATLVDSIVLSQGSQALTTLATGAVLELTYMFNQENFGLIYKNTKRVVPAILLYSTLTANTKNVVTGYLAWTLGLPPTSTATSSTTADILIGTIWSAATIGKEGFNFNIFPDTLGSSTIVAPQQSVGTNSFYFASASLSFHYTLDARLGVV